MTVSNARGRVYVVSTPIGNLEDLSPRARRVLREADVIACEDTRQTARLCARYEIRTRRVSLHAHNEAHRVPQLLRRLEAGASVALVSDAGTPLLSDPGAAFVRAAIEAGLAIVPVPGPSAILASLVASGLSTRPFSFFGFLPRKGRARREWLERLARAPGTLVLFEAPGRVRATLVDLERVLGARRVVVARELTKRFEQIVRGRLGELELPEPRGEVTLVIEGAAAERPGRAVESEDAQAFVERFLRDGGSARDAARELAVRLGISKSQAYRRVLDLTR